MNIPDINWLERTLTIDPGLEGTGLAFWVGTRKPITTTLCLNKLDKKEKFIVRAWKLTQMLETFCFRLQRNNSPLPLETCYIEWPGFWGSSAISNTAARKGDLGKLYGLSGMYAYVLQSRGVEVRLLTPQDWKGQLKNEAVVKRVQFINGTEYSTQHEYDAVGIGLDRAGVFKNLRGVI